MGAKARDEILQTWSASKINIPAFAAVSPNLASGVCGEEREREGERVGERGGGENGRERERGRGRRRGRGRGRGREPFEGLIYHTWRLHTNIAVPV